MDEKNIFLQKGNDIIGLHTIVIKENSQFEHHDIPGNVRIIRINLPKYEKWGIIYDLKGNILDFGRLELGAIRNEKNSQRHTP